MVSLLRTIQLDASDGILFATAATPGEWAVPGGFLFHDRPFDSLSRKERVAYRSAFLGIESFGFSTLAVVTLASEDELAAATDTLAQAFVSQLGAPDLAMARLAAAEEIAFAADLCRGHDEGRLIALHREEDDNGQIRERFRALRPREGSHWQGANLAGHERPFQFIQTDDPGSEDLGPEEDFDLFTTLRPTGQPPGETT